MHWPIAQWPVDGQGLAPPDNPALAELRRWAAARAWSRVPGWSRPPLVLCARLLWVVVAGRACLRFARDRALPAGEALRLWSDCVLSGAAPVDALAWRKAMAPAPHPLPARAAAVLLPRLGDRAAHAVLADKQATAVLLEAAGLPTPPLLDTIPRGGAADFGRAAWTRPGRLFVKPRHGHAARGTLAVEVAEGTGFRVDGAPIAPASLQARLSANATGDDLLVQHHLDAAADLADLTVGDAAPVLRLTTLRAPGGEPRLHSALLCLRVPDENPRAFLRGQLYVPVSGADGRLGHGVILGRGEQRLTHAPWNGAALAGRRLAGFDTARAMVLRAAEMLPALPLVSWDLILTAEGPVILEGNSGGNWLLTTLPRTEFPENDIIEDILLRWMQRTT